MCLKCLENHRCQKPGTPSRLGMGSENTCKSQRRNCPLPAQGRLLCSDQCWPPLCRETEHGHKPSFLQAGPPSTPYLQWPESYAAQWGGRGWTAPSLCPFEPKEMSGNIHPPGQACLCVMLGVLQHEMTSPRVAGNGARFLKLGPQAPFTLGLRLFLVKEICQK